MTNIDWEALAKIVGVTAGSGGLLIVIINWIRHKREDAANADKTLAEAKKTQEEVKNLKFERDKSVFDLSIKMAERLALENQEIRQELDNSLDEGYKLRKEVELWKSRHDKLLKELEEEKEKNRNCSIEIEQLKIQIKRLKPRRP